MSLHYFISDVHLGLKVRDFKEREMRLYRALASLPDETGSLYLLGDIFDFWFEYKSVVPKGFVRIFGELARLVDRGVKVSFLRGNHDLWTFGYFGSEIGIVEIERQPHIVEIEGVRFFLAHGDGFDKRDRAYLFLKSVFYNRFLQRAFGALHPRWAFALANRWSLHNRLSRGELHKFDKDRDILYRYAVDYEDSNNGETIDCFVFGHHHTPIEIKTPAGARFFILGDWVLNRGEYLVYDSDLKEFKLLRGY